MDPQDRQLLQETYRLSQENNKMLSTMHRAMMWGRVWRALYWVVIIGLTVGAFYFIEPYLQTLLDTYGALQSNAGDIQNLFDSIPSR